MPRNTKVGEFELTCPESTLSPKSREEARSSTRPPSPAESGGETVRKGWEKHKRGGEMRQRPFSCSVATAPRRYLQKKRCLHIIGGLESTSVAHIRQRTGWHLHFLTRPFVLTWAVLSTCARLDLLAGFLRGKRWGKRKNGIRFRCGGKSVYVVLFDSGDAHFSEAFLLGFGQQQRSASGRLAGFFTGTFNDKNSLWNNAARTVGDGGILPEH